MENKKIKKEAEKLIAEYLLNHLCVDCGEDNIVILEFNHINKKQKDSEVSVIIRNTSSIKKLKNELSKCNVRCANCHRIKTAKEINSWKLRYIN